MMRTAGILRLVDGIHLQSSHKIIIIRLQLMNASQAVNAIVVYSERVSID